MLFLCDFPIFYPDVISWCPSVENLIETPADQFQIPDSLGIEGDTWSCMMRT